MRLGALIFPSTEYTSVMAFHWLDLTQLNHLIIRPESFREVLCQLRISIGAHELRYQDPGLCSHSLACDTRAVDWTFNQNHGDSCVRVALFINRAAYGSCCVITLSTCGFMILRDFRGHSYINSMTKPVRLLITCEAKSDLVAYILTPLSSFKPHCCNKLLSVYHHFCKLDRIDSEVDYYMQCRTYR